MLLGKLGIILALCGCTTAWIPLLWPREDPTSSPTRPSTASAQVQVLTYTTSPIPSQSVPTSRTTQASTSTHAMGWVPVSGPSTTETGTATRASTIDWSTLVTADLADLVSRPRATVTYTSEPGIKVHNHPEPSSKRVRSKTAPLADKEKRAVPVKRSNAPVVDWRDYYGQNWLATIQDQDHCEACWAFSATALVETQARIEHGLWNKRSEADIHDMEGKSCLTANSGGDPGYAVNYSSNNQVSLGVCDVQCDPYTKDDQPWSTCGDRNGRALHYPISISLYTFEDQRTWLNLVGPLAICLGVCPDFGDFDWDSGKAYVWNGLNASQCAGHCPLIVGYDDNIGGWLFRNSWGTWGMGGSGYGYIAFNGTPGIDTNAKVGINNMDVDDWSKRRHHNGMMYESRSGQTHRDFQALRNLPSGGLRYITREGEAPYTWSVLLNPLTDGENSVANGQPVVTGTSFNGDIEVVYVTTEGRFSQWYYSQRASMWFWVSLDNAQATEFSQVLSGYPGYTQMDNSSFSLVVMNSDGALREYIRNAKTGWWSNEFDVYDAVREVSPPGSILQSGPALVQSNVNADIYTEGSYGNLYVVAVLQCGEMQLFWRKQGVGVDEAWKATERFGGGVGNTPPVMIQDFWTADEKEPGGFQLLVAVNGEVQHWQRINNDINSKPPESCDNSSYWELVHTFGSCITHVWSLVQGSYANALEAIVEDNEGDLWHWQYTNAGWAEIEIVPGKE